MSASSGYVLSPLTPISQSAFNAANNRIIASQYDPAGNQIVDGQSRTFEYDGENRQTRFNGANTQYFYDGDARRVKKVVAGNPTTTTVFVYDVGGELIAEYTSDPVPPPPGLGGTSYLTTDHLGSTRVVTKNDGTVKARYDYLPFGEELGSGIGGRTVGMGYGAADTTNQKFTQKERDSESGLDYFLARYYSSAQGRFTSVDPIEGTKAIPQSWNGYAYVLNNPLRFTDPDGLFPPLIIPVTTTIRLKNWVLHGYFEDDVAWERRVQAARNFLRGQELLRQGLYVQPRYGREISPGQYEAGSWARLDLESLSDDDAVAWASVFSAAIERGNVETLSPEEMSAADKLAGVAAFLTPA